MPPPASKRAIAERLSGNNREPEARSKGERERLSTSPRSPLLRASGSQAIEFVYLLRGNNVVVGKEEGLTKSEGVGYGDSYLVDPHGEIVVRSRRLVEDFIFADIDTTIVDKSWSLGRSLYSYRQLGKYLQEAAEQK